MPTFITLPREVGDIIYTFAATTAVAGPPDTRDKQFDKQSDIDTICSMRGVCGQMKDEVASHIQRNVTVVFRQHRTAGEAFDHVEDGGWLRIVRCVRFEFRVLGYFLIVFGVSSPKIHYWLFGEAPPEGLNAGGVPLRFNYEGLSHKTTVELVLPDAKSFGWRADIAVVHERMLESIDYVTGAPGAMTRAGQGKLRVLRGDGGDELVGEWDVRARAMSAGE